MKIFDWLAASAVEEPEMPAKNTDSSTLICASAPGKMADHGARQVHQAVGDAADVHQVGGQQEERHREQDEGVVGVEGFLHQLHRVEARLDEQDRQAGEAERERHRHAQHEQRRRRRRTGSSAAIAGERTAPPVIPRLRCLSAWQRTPG